LTLDYGRVYIEYGQGAGNGEMRLACAESPKVDIKEDDLGIFNMPGDNRTSVSGIETITRKVMVQDIFFKSESDFIGCIHNLRKLNKAGTITLQWAKDNVPNFIEFWSDGTSDYATIEVKYKDFKGGEKVSKGNQTKFHVRSILFIQAG